MAKKKFIMTVFMLLLLIAAFTVHSSGLMLPVPGEPKADNFTLMSANGGEISLQDYRGNFVSLSSWEVAGLPTTFLVNPAGEIIYRATGERVWDSNEMVGFLEKIMSGHERVALIEPPDNF